MHFRAEADLLLADAVFDQPLEAVEGATAYEEDVGGVDLDEVLVRVLASALRRDVRNGALEDLEQRLLNPFPGHVPRERGVVRLAGDPVNPVDVATAALGRGDVEVR